MKIKSTRAGGEAPHRCPAAQPAAATTRSARRLAPLLLFPYHNGLHCPPVSLFSVAALILGAGCTAAAAALAMETLRWAQEVASVAVECFLQARPRASSLTAISLLHCKAVSAISACQLSHLLHARGWAQVCRCCSVGRLLRCAPLFADAPLCLLCATWGPAAEAVDARPAQPGPDWRAG